MVSRVGEIPALFVDVSMKMISLGEWLERARERRGLSQNQLAIAAGVDPSTINKMEAGLIETPRKSTLKKIAFALNVAEGEIFLAAGFVPTSPEIERTDVSERWGGHYEGIKQYPDLVELAETNLDAILRMAEKRSAIGGTGEPKTEQ